MNFRRALLALACGAALVVGSGQAAPTATPTELFFSEYIEGSSNNKALEIYNGTGSPIDLGAGSYNVQMCFNGNSTCTLTINLTGAVGDGETFVLAHSSADPAILSLAHQTNGAGWFNGDDAVVLRKGTTVLDVIGQIGFDPGTEWGSGLTSTADNTLRRKSAIDTGDADGSNAFDPSVEWDGFATNTFGGLGFHHGPAEYAPHVQSTNPVGGASGVARDASITVRFSEPVAVTGSWFSIACDVSGTHTATATGGPLVFTLDPGVDFTNDEECTVGIEAANVSDQDANDPPDAMAADFSFTFRTAEVFACGEPARPIHAIQGSGASSPLVGQSVSIEGVVVGDYQGAGEFNGYYVQEEDADADADPTTSEGIFVFAGSSGAAVDAGDVVRVRGTVTEFAGLTEIASVSEVAVCSSGASVSAAAVSLPVANVADLERYEGMLVSLDQLLTVTEVFGLGRFGEVGLSGAGRLYNPTAVAEPGAAANAVAAQNDRSRIVLDDGSNDQNVDPTRYPQGGLSASNTLRVGDTLPSGVTGVMDYRFSNYRLQPVGPISFTHANPRPPAPAPVGGTLKVASFNVLNYFNGDGSGGGFPTPRGADTASELERQTAKIVSALAAIDADVVGLMEIENDGGPSSALADLVAALNAEVGAGTYAYVETGVIGTDEIKVALIHKAAKVAPVGDWEILTSAVDPRFLDSKNRPTLAQTFIDLTTGHKLTVAVNHLKSKGSDCNDVGDPDLGDEAGNCNLTRTRAAEAMADWLATDPTGSGDPDVLIIGDLNSYTFEDPIDALVDAGYANLVRAFNGLDAYSYVFEGESGYLDHALASASLAGQVSGTTEWHINPDEPAVLDYNVEFKSANHVETLYAPGPYRASDHDPVLVGLDLAVTFASLRELTSFWVDDPTVAAGLNDKLLAAEAAADRGNEQAKEGALRAYVNQVRAQSGKTLTAEQAETLIRLAQSL